jgi:hypothetical protein
MLCISARWPVDRPFVASCVYKLTEIFARITLLPVRSLCARTTRHIGRCPLVRRSGPRSFHPAAHTRARPPANPSASAVDDSPHECPQYYAGYIRKLSVLHRPPSIDLCTVHNNVVWICVWGKLPREMTSLTVTFYRLSSSDFTSRRQSILILSTILLSN